MRSGLEKGNHVFHDVDLLDDIVVSSVSPLILILIRLVMAIVISII